MRKCKFLIIMGEEKGFLLFKREGFNLPYTTVEGEAKDYGSYEAALYHAGLTLAQGILVRFEGRS